MKLVSLSLENFRQHRASQVTLEPGLSGIIGPNGAGKTSLVEAIAFALYGSKALRGRVDDAKSRGTERQDECLVSLIFEHDQHTWRIERSLDGAELFLGGEAAPIVQGNREVGQKISQILGMSLEEFVATYLTEQKGLEFLSGVRGATEREKFILRMLGYDKVEALIDSLRTERRDRKSELQGGEASLGDLEELSARLSHEARELESIKAKHADAGQTLEKTEKEVELSRKSFLVQEGLKSETAQLRQSLIAEQVRYEEKVRRTKEIEENRRQVRDTLIGLCTLVGLPTDLDVAGAQFKSQAKELEQSCQELGRMIESKSEEAKKIEIAWREEVSRLRALRQSQEAKVSAAKTRTTSLLKLDPSQKCTTCGQELGDSFLHVQTEAEADFKNSELELAQLRDLEHKQAAEPAELIKLREFNSEQRQKLVQIEDQIKKLAGFESGLSNLERLEADLSQDRLELSECDKRLQQLRAEISKSRYSEENYHREKGRSDAANRLMEVARLQKVRLEGELGTKKALLDRTKQEIENYHIRSGALKNLRRRLSLLEEGDRVLSEFRRYINASVRPRLAELASEFITDLTDGRYTTVELSQDFSPQVVEDGEAKPVVSGGEEDILNLCLRLALSSLLAERAGHSFSLLILDEVFGSLDEQRRNNVLGLLERLQPRFEQILVITHLEDIKEGVQHLIYVDYDEATGQSRVGELIEPEMAVNI